MSTDRFTQNPRPGPAPAHKPRGNSRAVSATMHMVQLVLAQEIGLRGIGFDDGEETRVIIEMPLDQRPCPPADNTAPPKPIMTMWPIDAGVDGWWWTRRAFLPGRGSHCPLAQPGVDGNRGLTPEGAWQSAALRLEGLRAVLRGSDRLMTLNRVARLRSPCRYRRARAGCWVRGAIATVPGVGHNLVRGALARRGASPRRPDLPEYSLAGCASFADSHPDRPDRIHLVEGIATELESARLPDPRPLRHRRPRPASPGTRARAVQRPMWPGNWCRLRYEPLQTCAAF